MAASVEVFERLEAHQFFFCNLAKADAMALWPKLPA
jgi:hypothetical protein